MIRSTMLAVALVAAPALVIAAQPAHVAPQAQQHDTTKAKSGSKHSSHHSSSKKGSTTAPKPAPAPAKKDSGSAK